MKAMTAFSSGSVKWKGVPVSTTNLDSSRARAEALIGEHRKSFDDGCWKCDVPYPCPTVLLARDVLELAKERDDYRSLGLKFADQAKELEAKVLAGLEREKALATSARESFEALQLEVQERRSLRVKLDELEILVEAAARNHVTVGDMLDALRAALDKAKVEEGM